MTLKEKILQVADDLEKEAFNYPRMRTMDVVNIVLRKLANEYNEEKIAEEFAIEFAEWVLDRFTFKDFIHKEPKELLEIFKKEK